MVEVSKPDYLSLVNQGGSGLNISELVTAMVASEIEPKKALHTDKKTKSDNAISGIGLLNSQSFLTQTAFDNRQNDNYFSITSSDASAVEFSSSDEMRLEASQIEVSNVQLAKKMVFELPGFTDLEANISQSIAIDFGSWSQTSTASSSSSNTVEAGKTYKVITRNVVGSSDGDAFDEYTRDPNDSDATAAFHGTPIEVGDIFRASQGFTNNDYTFQEVDAHAFTERSGNSTVNVTLSGTVENVVTQLNAVSDISAKLVKTSSTGTDTYSIVLSSDDTGLTNGFQISAGGVSRWETTGTPSTNSESNTFGQLSRDASLDVNSVSVSRSSNSIDDIIDGITVDLKADTTSPVQLNVARSSSNIKASVEDIIDSLNEFKSELKSLTLIDIEGGKNGPLAMDPTVTRLNSNFKKLVFEPLKGYGEQDIYLSQLGVKTNDSGDYYLDETSFDNTFGENPEYFNALKDNNFSSNSGTVTLAKSQFTSIPAGSYTVAKDGNDWKIDSVALTRADYNGGSKFSTSTFPGMAIFTAETNPASFEVYVGKSFSEKISEFMEAILASNSSLSAAETAYTTTSSDLSEKLQYLEEREALITTRYTAQFGAMEQEMTQFNSTKTLLENFIEAWKKQK